MTADHIDALLASTPLSIDDLRYDPVPRAGSSASPLESALRAAAPTGGLLEATLTATDVPVDREHLAAFLDEQSLDQLLDELGWGGSLDLLGVRVLTSRDPQDELVVGVEGPLLTSGMQLSLGVPLRVSSARFELERLVLEGERTNAWLRVEDLYATLAGRRIERAWMNATFLDGRVVLSELEGVLDGGLLHGARGTLPAPPAFSFDLAPPHHFELALAFESVDVSAFLRGLLDPAALAEGRLQGELLLQGELGRLLSVHGGGHARLTDARLAGIPVVRELLRVLGIDKSATFDEMSTRFVLEDGHLGMHEMRVESDLAELLGAGNLDLSGALSHRFDVRFAPAPLLGPLEPIWALFQGQIFWVELEGDMRSPQSHVRLGPIQPFNELITEDASQRGLELPAPRYARPRARF